MTDLPQMEYLPEPPRDKRVDVSYMGVEVLSFEDLRRWLASIPNQSRGTGITSMNGRPYIEFSQMGIARPGDEAMVERVVAQTMQHTLVAYFSLRPGHLYWRLPLETDISAWSIITRYDDEGPDQDWITNRRCHVDKNWLRVAAYCRLVKEPQP